MAQQQASSNSKAPYRFEPGKKPKHDCIQKAFDLLCAGAESVNYFSEAFKKDRKQGAPSNSDQDLLRSMVVFAGATIDAVIKQAIRDGIRPMMAVNLACRKHAHGLISRRILDQLDDAKRRSVLANALLDDSPSTVLIEYIITDATDSSLQSVEGVNSAYAVMGTKAQIAADALKEAFDVRNCIIHELDALGKGTKNRSRTSRTYPVMTLHANVLLETARDFLHKVDGALGTGKRH